MADPLSAISLGIQVAQGLVHYVRSFRGYDREIDVFVSSVERLKINLQLTRDYLEDPASQFDSEAKLMREQLEKNVRDVNIAIADLQRELQKLQPDEIRSGLQSTIKKFGRQAAWHFRKDALPRLQTTVADILRNLELGINNHQLVQIGFIRKAMSEIQAEQRNQQIESWLAAPDHSTKHKITCQRHLAGTASWILNEPPFKQWVIEPGVLWLTGIAGSGKTVLCSTIIEEMRKKIQTEAGYKVAYFYFQYNDSVNGSAEMLAKSLIYQMSFTSNYCAKELENLYEACQLKREAPSLDELITVLLELIRSFAGIVIVLDALDEAPDPAWLWKVLKALSAIKIHLLLACRPNVEIRPEIQTLQPRRIQIDPSKVEGDIRAVVKARLSSDEKLRLFSESHAKIESSLMEKAGGMFKLVDSQLDRLRACRTTAKMNAALESIPHDLDETWMNCFSKIHLEDLDDSIRLLTLLCFSQRPFRVDELIDALAAPDDWIPGFDLASTRLKDPQALLDLGSGLVENDQNLGAGNEISKKTTVRLAHASVKEWLQSDKSSSTFSHSLPFVDSKGHGIIAQLCIQYLTQFDTECGWTKQDLLKWPMAEYSALYWRVHLSKSTFPPKLIDLACKPLLNDTMRQNWRRILFCRKRRPARRNFGHWLPLNHRGVPLAYAASCPLDPVVKHLFREHRVDANDSGPWKTALEVAVEQGQLPIIATLINNGADTNARSWVSAFNSILSLACNGGSLDIVRYLCDNGARDVVTDRTVFPTALTIAASLENDALIRLLLDRGHSVNTRSGNLHRFPLHEAADSLRLSNIQLLLDHGAKKELTDGKGNIPLHLAVQYTACTPEIARLLTYNGAPSVMNESGNSPLAVSISGNVAVCETLLETTSNLQMSKSVTSKALAKAAARGFLGVVETLHQRGAGFTEDEEFALIGAVANGHTNVVKYLLDQGHTTRIVNSEGLTPFLSAVKNGHRQIWELLADSGAELNALDPFGRNACHLMIAHSNAEGLEWLLERGVDYDRSDANGETVLHLAAMEGKVQILRTLVMRGAKLDVTDNHDGSVCHFAAANGHLEILQWLSEQGVTMNAADKFGSTPFLTAVRYGHLDCVEFLSGRTPDFRYSRLRNGCTALALAAEKGCVDLVRWMLEENIDVNERFAFGESPQGMFTTALQCAIEASEFGMTRFLLEHGADPNLSTGHGTTAVLLAAEWRPLAYLTLLVEYDAQIHDIQDNDGDDVLLLATGNPDEEVLHWAITHLVGHCATNKYGFSPMLVAAMFGRVGHIQALHVAGLTGSTTGHPVDNETSESDIRRTSIWYAFRCLKSPYERLDVRDRYTPLMVAAFRGHLEAVEYFITQFSDMQQCVDKDGNSALTYACCAGNLDVVEFLIGSEINASKLNLASRSVREETEQCLQSLGEDHLIEEGKTEDAEFRALVSSIDGVLYYLRDLEGQRSDGCQKPKNTTQKNEMHN